MQPPVRIPGAVVDDEITSYLYTSYLDSGAGSRGVGKRAVDEP